jgi:hypothetical protein
MIVGLLLRTSEKCPGILDVAWFLLPFGWSRGRFWAAEYPGYAVANTSSILFVIIFSSAVHLTLLRDEIVASLFGNKTVKIFWNDGNNSEFDSGEN